MAHVALCWGAGVGPKTVRALLKHFGSATAVLQASPDDLSQAHGRLRPETAEEIAALSRRLEEVESELVGLDDDGIRVLCPDDDDFPPLLAHIRNPPAILSVRGNTEALHADAVAIVGTRSPTPEGEALARRWASELAAGGWCIASGLALGIDTAGHRGALDAGGRTVAVFGAGILRVWPRENRGLAEEIADAGALVSELPPNAHANVARLMARNRIQSGLSRAVIIVETREEGGSMVTGSYARRQKRLLFAVDWPADKPEGAGTRRLIEQGAIALSPEASAEEIVARVREWAPPEVPREDRQLKLL